MSDGVRDGLWDVEVAAEQQRERRTFLRFRYVNHRGEDHEYLVAPIDMEYSRCRCFPDEPEREAWNIKAQVRTRDGETRPGVRNFAIIKMREVEEVRSS